MSKIIPAAGDVAGMHRMIQPAPVTDGWITGPFPPGQLISVSKKVMGP